MGAMDPNEQRRLEPMSPEEQRRYINEAFNPQHNRQQGALDDINIEDFLEQPINAENDQPLNIPAPAHMNGSSENLNRIRLTEEEQNSITGGWYEHLPAAEKLEFDQELEKEVKKEQEKISLKQKNLEEIESIERKERLNIVKEVARMSIEGVKEQDLEQIYIAIMKKRLSAPAIKALIKSGLDKYINNEISNLNGRTLLTAAIISLPDTNLHNDIIFFDKGHNANINALEIVKLLVSIGAKIDTQILNLTIIINHEAFKFLLEEKARQDKAEQEEQDKERAKRIKFIGKDKIEDIFGQEKCTICLEEFTDETENLTKLPCKHIFNEDCIAQALLSKDDKNNLYKNKCPFCRAELNEEFIEKYFLSLLEKKREDLEFKQQLLFYAATKASVNILNKLFKENSGIKVDVNAQIDAMKYYDGSVDEIGQFIEKQETGWTPLHFAAYGSNGINENKTHKRLEAIQLLVDNNADYNAKNSRGLKPKHLITNRNSNPYHYLNGLFDNDEDQ
jgi:RING-finger-containing ubiquitin ligase